MIKTILTIVVCWSFTFVVNGQNRRGVSKYLPATPVINYVMGNPCMTAATLDEPAPVLTKLSFRFGHYPQTTRTDYRKMVVMRDVLIQSTHPPQVGWNAFVSIHNKNRPTQNLVRALFLQNYLTFYIQIINIIMCKPKKTKIIWPKKLMYQRWTVCVGLCQES